MKIALTISSLILLFSCNGIIQEESSNETTDRAIQETVSVDNDFKNKIDTLKSEYFSIALLDFHRGELTRLFIVIPEDNVYNYELISQIVCEIENHYEVFDHTNLSFFPDKRYAGYKDSLFINENHPLEMSEYEQWMDSYYMAEFQYGSRDYQTFPATQKMKKKKREKIKACT